MRRIIIAFLAVLLCGPVMAQEPTTLSKKEQRKLLKEEKEKQEALEAERKANLIDMMIKERLFVLEANMLFDRYGNSQTVHSNINFIAVDLKNKDPQASDKRIGVIQVGDVQYIGSNGLGGITLEGDVFNYEWKKNKKRSTYQVNYSVSTVYGSYDITMGVSKSGNADATVRGTFSGSLRYSGKLVYPPESKVFKGSSY